MSNPVLTGRERWQKHSGRRAEPFSKMARMKKTSSAAAKSVEEYFAAVPEPARTTLNKMCAMIRAVAPAETTETISYGIPTFKYKGSLVALGAFKNHCSLFPMGSSVLEAFKHELRDFQVTKGTLRFPVDEPMPATLVKKIVKARIAQNERKNKERNTSR